MQLARLLVSYIAISLSGDRIPRQFSAPMCYVNSEFLVATGAPPTVQLTVINDSLVTDK